MPYLQMDQSMSNERRQRIDALDVPFDVHRLCDELIACGVLPDKEWIGPVPRSRANYCIW